ncbi:polyprenyl synthetase family protein [Planctomycetota bacterium]
MRLPSHTDIAGTFDCIDNDLDRVKDLLTEEMSDCPDASVGEFVGYFNRYWGKMLRPALVLLSASACGPVADEHIHLAAIMELIHNATLLHDDVIDEGKMRRGAPTINSLWGNESAVLLGDFLLSKAFRMCAALPPHIIRKISATTIRLCEGELRQIIQRQNWRLSEDEYIEIITEKSAALFSVCCELGALVAGSGKTDVKSLASFGLNTGITFQITDDLLDIIGDENKTGKTLGSDVSKNKLTLALIHLLKTVDEKKRQSLKRKLSAAEENKQTLKKMLGRFGSLEYAQKRARHFAAKAVESLAGLKQSGAKDALIQTAGLIAARAKTA